MKEGQRYWATFALRHIQSFLCAEKMQELLATDTEDNNVHLEQGALLLVITAHSLGCEDNKLPFHLACCLFVSVAACFCLHWFS